MPLASSPKPDQVITMGSPAVRPAAAERASAETIRARTVSASDASSSATSSPPQRYVASWASSAGGASSAGT